MALVRGSNIKAPGTEQGVQAGLFFSWRVPLEQLLCCFVELFIISFWFVADDASCGGAPNERFRLCIYKIDSQSGFGVCDGVLLRHPPA